MQYRTNKKKISRESDETTNMEELKSERRKLKNEMPSFGNVSNPWMSIGEIARAIAVISWNRYGSL